MHTYIHAYIHTYIHSDVLLVHVSQVSRDLWDVLPERPLPDVQRQLELEAGTAYFGLGDRHVVLSFAECAVNLCAVPAMPPKCLLAPPGGGIWCVVDVVGVASLKWPMRFPANNNLAWLYKYEILILLEKLIQKTSFGIEVRQWEGFKMLIWRCINA